MNRFRAVLLLSIFLLLPGFAGCSGSDPASQPDTIDGFRAKRFRMMAQQEAETERLVTEGNELGRAGDDERVSVVFEEAVKILKHTEDADPFSKSE